MALIPSDQYFILVDVDTGVQVVARGIPSNYVVVGPLTSASTLRDLAGDAVEVVNGRLEVTAENDLPLTHTFPQLAAVGVTASFAVELFQDHQFFITVANINDSVDVTAEGSDDDTAFFNLDATGADTQYTANDTYLMHKSNFRCRFVRFSMTAEAGGAAVTVDVDYLGGR